MRSKMEDYALKNKLSCRVIGSKKGPRFIIGPLCAVTMDTKNSVIYLSNAEPLYSLLSR